MADHPIGHLIERAIVHCVRGVLLEPQKSCRLKRTVARALDPYLLVDGLRLPGAVTQALMCLMEDRAADFKAFLDSLEETTHAGRV